LKIDLAQFRGLQAFATFGSELDRVSRNQLDRGARLTEVLKQPQNSPMPVEEEVISIYAGTRGFLDDLAVEDVRDFEAALLQYLRADRPEMLEQIRTTKDMPTGEALDDAIKEVKKGFATISRDEATPGEGKPGGAGTGGAQQAKANAKTEGSAAEGAGAGGTGPGEAG
jgi:F-type H+/Na+-transporting ATPase subunit alpha